MASPFGINAGLSFGSGGGCIMSNPAGGYQAAYNNYLSLNQQNYNNILAGYKQISDQAYAAQQNIQAGYTGLQQNVCKTISDICQSQMHNVQCTYTKLMGQTQQQAIQAGLGNSTVLQSMQRGVTKCEAAAQTNVKNQFAQTKAGYMSNLGLAGLNYANAANQQNMALGAQAMGFLSNVNIPPPCARAYMSQYNQNMSRWMAPGGTTMGPMGGGPSGVGGMASARGPIGNIPGGAPGGGGYGGGGSNMLFGCRYCRCAVGGEIRAGNNAITNQFATQPGYPGYGSMGDNQRADTGLYTDSACPSGWWGSFGNMAQPQETYSPSSFNFGGGNDLASGYGSDFSGFGGGGNDYYS